MLLWKPTRLPVLNLARTAATSIFALLGVGLWVWTSGIVALSARAHLWTGDLVKDTIVWAIGPALVLTYRLPQASSDPRFFRRTVLETAKISVFVEFYVNLHVFGFVQELILIPVVTVVAILAQFAGTDQKYHQVKQVFNFILAVIGIALLVYVTGSLVANWHQEDPLHDIRDVVLPMWLTLGAVPYIYGVGLLFNYQGAFLRLDLASKDPTAARRAKAALLIELNVRSHRVGAFGGPWITRLAEAPSLAAARGVAREFRRDGATT